MIVIPLQAANDLEGFIAATVPIFYILGIMLSVLFPLTIFLFWKRMMPPILKTLFWAFRRREPLLLLCHDSGRSILTTIHERQGEGIVLTAQGKYKILPRFAPKLPLSEIIKKQVTEILRQRLAFAQPNVTVPDGENPDPAAALPAQLEQTNENGQEGETQAPDEDMLLPQLDLNAAFDVKLLKDNFILDYGDYTNKRSMLIGLDLPVFVGYTGKLCLLNPEALALYEAGDMLVRTADQEMFNPMNYGNKTMADAMQPLLLVNPRKIQEIISQGFDQSQIAGVVADSEELVRTQMAAGLGGLLGGKMKWIIIFAIMACAGVAGVLFLPQLIKNFSQQGQAPQAIILPILERLLR